MQFVNIGSIVRLRPDSGFVRCCEYNDDAIITYRILEKEEMGESSSDISADSRIGRILMNKKRGDVIQIPLEETEVSFPYVITEIY